MTAWEIVPVMPETLDRAAELHELCFPGESWSRADFAGILQIAGASGHWAIDAADPAHEPQGFLFDMLLGTSGEIVTLGVAPAARRRGAARALLEDMLARARALGIASLTLEVAEDNAAGLALYRALGFEQVGRRRDYYRRPDASLMDARLLRRSLLP
ncbi:MAG TPA: GNAT family N-acetyltransferase [Stellaceae bacterium]|nr:GNAT family N-acetyltransferase [Stellaceae bacterium]